MQNYENRQNGQKGVLKTHKILSAYKISMRKILWVFNLAS